MRPLRESRSVLATFYKAVTLRVSLDDVTN